MLFEGKWSPTPEMFSLTGTVFLTKKFVVKQVARWNILS